LEYTEKISQSKMTSSCWSYR